MPKGKWLCVNLRTLQRQTFLKKSIYGLNSFIKYQIFSNKNYIPVVSLKEDSHLETKNFYVQDIELKPNKYSAPSTVDSF